MIKDNMITLKDIADEAGVSTATVSNVINGNMSRVSSENASRIQEIIEKRRYVPNSSARTLAAKSSHIIAGVIPGDRGINMLLDPYNAEFFGELICTVQAHRYYLMIRYVNNYEEVIHSIQSWNVDGAIFVGTPDEYIERLHTEIHIPLIFTDSYAEHQQISKVGIDDFKGGVLAAEHFFSKGHRSLGFVGYTIREQKKDVVSERVLGFSSALDAHGIKLAKKQCFYVSEGGSRKDIQEVAAQLAALKGKITGIFVSADKLAIALMKALAEHGMNVPEDISIIGFDDVSITANIVPGLTTIRQNISQKAQIATGLLFNRIAGKQPLPNPVLEVTLVERDSVLQL